MTTTVGPVLANVRFVNADGTLSAYAIRFINQQILDRIGGVVAQSNTELSSGISDLDSQALAPAGDPLVHQAMVAIDELRNELASLRSDCDQLLQQIAERDSELLRLREMTDLRLRVEQLEDRNP